MSVVSGCLIGAAPRPIEHDSLHFGHALFYRKIPVTLKMPYFQRALYLYHGGLGEIPVKVKHAALGGTLNGAWLARTGARGSSRGFVSLFFFSHHPLRGLLWATGV